jgi:predicted F0F1-ATPase subunit
MVGWPVALGAAGGALLGRYLDHRWNMGVQCTLLLLTVGILLGCFLAWRTVTRLHD